MAEPASAEEQGVVCPNPKCLGTRFDSIRRYPGPGYFRRRLVCRRCKRVRYTYEIPSEWFHRLAHLLESWFHRK
jgi:hypothetical protein